MFVIVYIKNNNTKIITMEVNKRKRTLEAAKLMFDENYDVMSDTKNTIMRILRDEKEIDEIFDYTYNEFCKLYLKSLNELLKNPSIDKYSDLNNSTGAMFLYATLLEDIKIRQHTI